MSNNSETMEINDCEIKTNEMNLQDMNSANKDDRIDLNYLMETTKCYQEKFRLHS